MNKRYFLIIILAVLVYSFNFFTDSSISNINNLSRELRSSPESLYNWNLNDQSPFKYRVLYKTIVTTSWKLLFSNQSSESFFLVYSFYAFLFLLTAGLTLYQLLIKMGFSPNWSFVGVTIFYISPPILMAFHLPVHTREDHLAYTLLNFGLIFIIQRKVILFLMISLLAVFCRETLLILPFIYFFYARGNILRRFMVASLPVLLFISIRFLSLTKGYNPLSGFYWNINNLDQVFGFIYLSFGPLWILFFIWIFNQPANRIKSTNIELFNRSSLATLGLIIISAFIAGIMNEIRLLYLFYPWIITISLQVLKSHKKAIQKSILNKNYLISAIFILGIFSIFGFYLVNNYSNYLEPSKFNIPFPLWIAVTLISLMISTLTVIVILSIIKNNKNSKLTSNNHSTSVPQ